MSYTPIVPAAPPTPGGTMPLAGIGGFDGEPGEQGPPSVLGQTWPDETKSVTMLAWAFFMS